jgi:hypothetical protein
MAERIESGEYFLDQEIEEARLKGYDEDSFKAGWRIGFSSASTLHKSREVPLTRSSEMSETQESSESPVILRPGETALLPPPGTRSVGTATAVKIVQAIKDSGWDLRTILIAWLAVVISLIVLGFGMKAIFGAELLAQGVAGFWSWWVQPG